MSRIPSQIGRYRVISKLGSGAFANVYLAEDPVLANAVAIKLLSEDQAGQGDIRERFINEAQIIRELASPGLVVIHDIGDQDGQPYFVMEHCQRGTLKERLGRLDRPINLAEAQGLIEALTSATAVIHTLGIVHRDLKPSNYLIRHTPGQSRPAVGELIASDEQLVVADFGLAKNLDIESSRLTLAGGTPGFSAPEQFHYHPAITTQADVFALSAIVIAAMAGVMPQAILNPKERAFTPEAMNAIGPLKSALAQGIEFEASKRQANAMQWHESCTEAISNRAEIAQPNQQQQSTSEPTLKSGISRRSMLATSVVAMVGVVGTTALAASSVRLPGVAIVGPSKGSPTDEAVFTTDGAESVTWMVNGQQQFEGRTISISPETPGRYSVVAASVLRSTTHSYTVEQPQNEMRIIGPGNAPINQATQFTAQGAKPGDSTWLVRGTTFIGNTIELNPSTTGTITITLTTSTGVISRTITATKATP